MLYSGLMDAANKAGIVIIGGETAETGVYTGSEIPTSMALRFNMEATAMGISHPDKLITGENLKPGQVIIALRENGFRSNGISSVRKAFATKFGTDWWTNPEAKDSIALAATPSIIYSKLISTLNGWYDKDFKKEVDIHAIAHITGGGIISKFGEDILFKKELSANFNNLFTPANIMEECRKWRGMTESEAYTTWNGGQGMLLVVDNNLLITNHIVMRAKEFGIDAKVCGFTHKWKNTRISIESKFGQKNKRLTYKAGE
jgi:phosphoribosylformylglycinamidine cyclo-ligase